MKKPKIIIEKFASIEVDRESLKVFKDYSAMEQERAVFIMVENVDALHKDGLEDNPELKEFVEKVLNELPEGLEYIQFYSM